MSDDRNQVIENTSNIITLEMRLDIITTNLRRLVHEMDEFDSPFLDNDDE